nr:hypothetical protein [Tanacetum cinerariifolium]
MRMLPLGLTSKNSVKNIMRTSYQSFWTKSAVTDEKMPILGWISKKVNEGRVRSTDLAKLTRQARPNPDPGGRILGTILGVEAVSTGWTLQMKIVQRIENAFVALENHMMILSPTPIVTETALAI